MSGYRGDIDGLRALAVLAVVIFHAGMGMPGGFVGVDVFFVISGYLITSIILADLERDSFSYRRFWERRIRRIWPASLVVLLGTLIAGWFIHFPADYRADANTTIAQLLMFTNVRAWLKTDYFAVHSDTDPLLHMWSLAVEEQFYVVLPLVLSLAWRWGRRRCAAVLTGIAACSLVASVLVLPTQPMGVFYLLPFRAWELLLGGLLAFPDAPAGRWWKEVLGWAGLALILYPCLSYDRFTPFPGLAALAPCCGAAAIMVAGSGTGVAGGSTLVSRVLGTPALATLGRMSYSIYLWHWPLLAFYRYCSSSDPPSSHRVLFFGLLAAVAYASWKWVELPLRAATKPPASTRALAFIAILSLLVGAGAVGISLNGGVPSRFAPATLRSLAQEACCVEWECASSAPESLKPIGAGRSGRPECFLLWGDSHGLAISSVVDEVAREFDVTGAAALKRGSIPAVFADVGRSLSPGELEAWNEAVLAWVRSHRPRHVILAARWTAYFKPVRDGDCSIETRPYSARSRSEWPVLERAMRDGLRRLLAECERTDSTVWCLFEVPYQLRGPRERIVGARWSGRAIDAHGTTRAAHDLRTQPVRAVFEGWTSSRLRCIDLSEPFFVDGDVSLVRSHETWWYADDDHLAPAGARLALRELIRGMFSQIAADCGRTSAAP